MRPNLNVCAPKPRNVAYTAARHLGCWTGHVCASRTQRSRGARSPPRAKRMLCSPPSQVATASAVQAAPPLLVPLECPTVRLGRLVRWLQGLGLCRKGRGRGCREGACAGGMGLMEQSKQHVKVRLPIARWAAHVGALATNGLPGAPATVAASALWLGGCIGRHVLFRACLCWLHLSLVASAPSAPPPPPSCPVPLLSPRGGGCAAT